jgi:hypothetical protein
VLVALAAAPVGLVAACRDSPRQPAPSASASSPPPPDPLTEDLAAERQLLGSYQATIARHPSLAKRLTPLRSDHGAHVAALERELGLAPSTPTAAPSATASTGSPTPSPSPDESAVAAVPGTPAAALNALRAAERAAARARSAACLTAPAARATLLASIAACEASHEAMLT